MLRLLKLVFVGVVSYAAYEFIRGFMEGEDGGPERDQGRPLPGLTKGKRVMTEDTTGESVPHFVGRGVVRR